MRISFPKFGLVALMCLMLLGGLLRPCSAQTPTLYDVSWAGNSAVPQLYVNVRGGVDNFFGLSGTNWTCVGRISNTSVTKDVAGTHVAVSANVLYASVTDVDFGDPTPAMAVLHVTIAPNGKVTEYVEIDGANVSLVTTSLPLIHGGVYFFWLP